VIINNFYNQGQSTEHRAQPLSCYLLDSNISDMIFAIIDPTAVAPNCLAPSPTALGDSSRNT